MRERNVFVSLILILIACLNFCIYGSELLHINSQYKWAVFNGQDIQHFNYPRETTIVCLIQSITTTAYYYLLYVFNKPLIKPIKNDYQLAFYLILSRWLFTSFPFSLWQIFWVDARHGFNRKPLTLFVCEELLSQFIILLSAFFLISFFDFISKTIANINDETVVLDTDVSENSNDFLQYSGTPPEKEAGCTNISINDILNLYYVIIVSILFTIGFFVKTIWIKSDTVQPNAKLTKSFTELYFIHGLTFKNPVINMESSTSTKLTIGLQGLVSKTVVISDNIINAFNNDQLSAILSVYQYRSNSQEGVLTLLTYIFEVMMIPFFIQSILNNVSRKVRLKNIAPTVIPDLFVYLFIVDFIFSKIRIFIQRKMFNNGMDFANDLSLPIADAIVRLFVLNRDTIAHSPFYTFFARPLPTLEQCLVYIALAKQKFVGII